MSVRKENKPERNLGFYSGKPAAQEPVLFTKTVQMDAVDEQVAALMSKIQSLHSAKYPDMLLLARTANTLRTLLASKSKLKNDDDVNSDIEAVKNVIRRVLVPLGWPVHREELDK